MTRTSGWLVATILLGGCSSTSPATTLLSREQMLDPNTCEQCHTTHFQEWSGSMHAYASDDPVFVAMNKKGQEETGGALGDFCLRCHAPMAVREHKTEGGMVDTTALPPSLKGVTCFFCHSTNGTDPSHPYNDSLTDSGDLLMRAAIKDPVKNGAHDSTYSALHDGDRFDSVPLCGSCHDIVTQGGAHVERTYEEWRTSSFAKPSDGQGQSCGFCHMRGRDDVVADGVAAQNLPLKTRKVHDHKFPGVDVALTDFPLTGDATSTVAMDQQQAVQDLLHQSLLGAVCVDRPSSSTFSLDVRLDNFGVGHRWPSGAGQDRRVWVEVIAYQAGKVIYHSGTSPDGTALSPGARVVDLVDPDLWLIRDCVFDAQGQPTHHFWQASSTPTSPDSNALPVLTTVDLLDPAYVNTHVHRKYPSKRAHSPTISGNPDRVTVRVLLQPIGADVIDDMGADLKAAVGDRIPIFSVLGGPSGADTTLEWTPGKAIELTLQPGQEFATSCAKAGAYALDSEADPAPEHENASCAP